MKDNLHRVLLVFGLLTVLAAGAYAQDADRAIVNVPFDFVAGNAKLSAGNYTVERVFSDQPVSLLLRGSDGQSVMLVTSIDDNSTGKTGLLFNRYGSQYFLSGIRTEAGLHRLPAGRTEKQAAQMVMHEAASAAGSQ